MAAKKSVWTSIVAVALLGLMWVVFESGIFDAKVSATTGPAGEQLAELRVAPAGSMDGYSRERFKHWTTKPEAGKNCNTREAVLARDGQNVRTNNACEATAGTWTSAYNGQQLTDPSAIDIDHMVPLANAWRSGANKWDDQRREQFANDMQLPQLVAVDASSNRSKGDQDPSQWKPERANWCSYATSWITVKRAYDLTVTEQEQKALQEMLATCG
ncbi:HNH endonuclease family protein [Saccharopolyspora sp. NPDC050642]|uniref:HNH endonuclease family protein n=1 Tax=Saccharopolyspora sp. NPDC050642 TaxID=3157099 RepID=UPI0033FBD031